MATNWALLLHDFSRRCLKMSDKRWKARCDTPASIYVHHHSLLSFLRRNWTSNQDRAIIYLCVNALSLDGTGDERASVIQERRFSMNRKNLFEHKWQFNVPTKPSLKEIWLGFTLLSISSVLGYADNFSLIGICHCSTEDSCTFERGSWWRQERGYKGSLVISLDPFRFGERAKWKLTCSSGYCIEKKKKSCFLSFGEAWKYSSSYLSLALK